MIHYIILLIYLLYLQFKYLATYFYVYSNSSLNILVLGQYILTTYINFLMIYRLIFILSNKYNNNLMYINKKRITYVILLKKHLNNVKELFNNYPILKI